MAVVDAKVDPWRRDHFEPGHFTASGFVASPNGSAVLLIEHARLGRWLQPGGHIESGDPTVEAAIRREVTEETSLETMDRLGIGLLHIDAHPIPARGIEPAHTHIDLTMAFRARDEAIGPVAEVLDARWVPFDEVVAIGADAAVLRGVSRLRALL